MHAGKKVWLFRDALMQGQWMQRVKDDGKRSQIDETFYARSFTGEMQNHSYAAGH